MTSPQNMLPDLAKKLVELTDDDKLEWIESDPMIGSVNFSCRFADVTVFISHNRVFCAVPWTHRQLDFTRTDADGLREAHEYWRERRMERELARALEQLEGADATEALGREKEVLGREEEASPSVELSPDDVEWAVNQIANLVTMRELVVHERSGGWQITVARDCSVEFDNRAGTLLYKGWAAPVARAQLSNLLTAYSRVEDVTEALDNFLTRLEQRATSHT